MKSAATVSMAVSQIHKLQSNDISAKKVKLPEGDVGQLLTDLMKKVDELTNKVKELHDKLDSLETEAVVE